MRRSLQKEPDWGSHVTTLRGGESILLWEGQRGRRGEEDQTNFFPLERGEGNPIQIANSIAARWDEEKKGEKQKPIVIPKFSTKMILCPPHRHDSGGGEGKRKKGKKSFKTPRKLPRIAFYEGRLFSLSRGKKEASRCALSQLAIAKKKKATVPAIHTKGGGTAEEKNIPLIPRVNCHGILSKCG